ncbi:hypothetical protein AB1Y20_008481 [Prymnesium parvum]|uniref:Uncharacterized protein n=1 Tax=Prymnesium parvum TaxID=97485 RepID=A0AB34IR85_PRYPA
MYSKLALVNTLAVYDAARHTGAALRVATLLAQTYSAAQHSTSAAVREDGHEQLLLCLRSSPRAGVMLRPQHAALCPLAFALLRARTLLVSRNWRAAAVEYRALVARLHELQGPLSALCMRASDVLRQAGLALLHEGEYHAFLALLEEHGAGEWADLLPLKADALLCANEPELALEACAAARARITRPDAPPPAGARVDEELLLRNNFACLLVAAGKLADAELELLRCVQLAPGEVAPVYNLALLLWQAGERRRASQHWLRFRKYPYQETSASVYEHYAAHVLPPPAEVPPHESHVSGHVSKESIAALDRMVLGYWAELIRKDALSRQWDGGGAAS